jgi:cytochrome d ubiquinol oxidase subunit I
MSLDPLWLSRVQWVWVICWHILLPAFTVGLASYIAVLEGLAFFTGKAIWGRISAFWTRIFAVSFGMGVVSGIVMPFQIGANWSRFADSTANVLGPLLAYEGLTAFFLEASFLGVLLFGRKLVPPWVHFFAGLMVAAGTLFSTFWILSVNSWMQTPAGFHLAGGLFYPDNWWKVIFNPSFPYRYLHNVNAFYITTGFVVLGVAAWLLRRGRSVDEAKIMMRMALNLLIVLVPLQMVLGDLHGLNTGRYQPAKLAAIEGLYQTAAPAPLTLFGIPDDKAGVMHDAIEIPRLGSLILTHSMGGQIRGLNSFPKDQRPPVGAPFFSFRLMVGIGVLMLFVAIVGQALRWGGRLYRARWFLSLCAWTAPLGFIAVIAGWTTTEVGRQPWTVYGLLRTAKSVTPSLTGVDVAISMTLYVLVYLIMYPTGLAFMAGLVRKGVSAAADDPPVIEAGRSIPPYVAPTPAHLTAGD